MVHTLKGASAALGYPVTAALCHSIEDLFSVLDESGVKTTLSFAELLR